LLIIGLIVNGCKSSNDIPDFSVSNTGPYIINTDYLDVVISNLDSVPHLIEEYDLLIEGADRFLSHNFRYVTEKPQVPAGGSINDYVSISRYWHPDSTGAHTIYRDGVTNPMVEQFDRPKLAEMSSGVYTLALAYYLSKNEDYAEKASEILKKWFFEPYSRMNPNMDFAQVRLGVPDTGGGGSPGIIDANDFIQVVDAVSLLYDSNSWSGNNHIELKEWFYHFSRWIIRNYNADAYNVTNVSTWLDVQRAIYFMLSEQEDKLNSDFYIPPVSERISTQFNTDGVQPFEVTRGRPQHYVYFNLRGYMNLTHLRKNRTATDRDWQILNTQNIGGLEPALSMIANHVLNLSEPGTFISEPGFDECRYYEILKPAAVAFNSELYENAAMELVRSGCRNSAISLVYPPLELLDTSEGL
ncbi:MAG: alginate lyase family protein, partial [Balneolaceae bacterium]|nr:alginate lyase family protein [Balneolaceae bacterium]